jgi:hypothetical protein
MPNEPVDAALPANDDTFDFAKFDPANDVPLQKPDYTSDDVNLDLPRGWCYLD